MYFYLIATKGNIIFRYNFEIAHVSKFIRLQLSVYKLYFFGQQFLFFMRALFWRKTKLPF